MRWWLVVAVVAFVAGCAPDPVVLGSSQVPCREHAEEPWVVMADDVSIEAVWTASWFTPTGGDLPGEGTARPADPADVSYVEADRTIRMRCPDADTVLWLTWVDASGY